jgi:hypothetical protein
MLEPPSHLVLAHHFKVQDKPPTPLPLDLAIRKEATVGAAPASPSTAKSSTESSVSIEDELQEALYEDVAVVDSATCAGQESATCAARFEWVTNLNLSDDNADSDDNDEMAADLSLLEDALKL